MDEQNVVYPDAISKEYTAYFDGIVTWDLTGTTDPFYNNVLRESFPVRGDPGKFDGDRFHCELVWMPVDKYIDYQISILRYDDPARRAYDVALSNCDPEDFLDDPDYDPFEAFVLSADCDIIESLISGITGKSSVIPAGILVYGEEGLLTDYQEGRHRSIALHDLGIGLIAVWIFESHPRSESL